MRAFWDDSWGLFSKFLFATHFLMRSNYNDETFELIIIQNNVLMTGGQLAPQVSEEVFLDQAWEWWEDYLKWEDKNIDESESSHLN
ncbi:hypothetical protein CHRY9393_03231 [Chryseobacterium fistulae]|uniref:Uncharacterized protein n=2 Tax=Chryseobacterium fistulae TaxID=2675058 RepID=A0A6N4XSS2_9FLAO|nr:hypothetical protein CHRY9393_03231 [Chryseobacterium fistulae]